MYTGTCMNQLIELQVQDPVLGEIVRRLVDDCQPERIYLFGSRARANAGADSDYDIMVVVAQSDEPAYRRAQRAHSLLLSRFYLLGTRRGRPRPVRWCAQHLALNERTSSRTLSVKDMTSITVTQARANLFKLLDQTAQSHEPIQITGRRQNGVLLSEDDFRAMQETVYLLSVPGMRASLRKARKAPLKAYTKDRPW